MTITAIDATHVRLNGKSVLISSLTVNLIAGKYLELIDTASGNELLPITKWDGIQNGATGAPYVSQAAFNAAMATVFGIVAPAGVVLATTGVAGLVKKAGGVPNTAAAQSGAYVQADVVSIVTELRALKTSLQAAGILG